MNTIFCHICDEELADIVESLPDKCPICDTRKYEIIQEIKSLEETEEASTQAQAPQIEIITTIAENPIVESDFIGKPQVVEPQINDSQVAEPSITENSKPESHVTQVEAFSSNVSAVVVEEQDPISDIVCYDDESDDGIIFKENISLTGGEKNIVFDDDEISDVVFDDTPDVVFDDVVVEKNKLHSKPLTPQKTGASSLEVLPNKETGFSKGSYLILYNAEKKAIAYFKIDEVGSIIIGRSSERGSQNDIDLTMAWKHAYKDKVGSNDFQDKMKMVKGISRKHALVRYDKSKKSYVFFHLSDKNYTIVKTQQGEKRERAPKNRNPIYLEPGSLISMGNHKNYIIMRFKEVK